MELKETYSNDRTRAVIDLNAIRHNYAVLREMFPGKKLMSVLKADAYGHGIDGIAGTCDALTDQFAVATVEEGKRLREAGAKKPVLLLGAVPEGRIVEAARLGLSFSVGSLAYAMKLRMLLSEAGLTADCQLKIDTGFNRTGFKFRDPGKYFKDACPTDWKEHLHPGSAPQFSPSDAELAVQQLQMVYRFRELSVTGTYTHLSVPESDFPEDEAFTRLQLARFAEMIRRLRQVGCEPGLVHAFSTGGVLKQKERAEKRKAEEPDCSTERSETADPDGLFDMIRVGMMVYGQCDTPEHYRELGLRQALRWSANLISITEVEEGESVGYGRMFTARRPTLLGVVSVGYADGYRRNYQGLTVLCGGREVPVVGRICMDFLMVDLTELEEAEPGMEVVLLGSQEAENGISKEITAIDISALRDSTCGEVTAAISARVPRYYV